MNKKMKECNVCLKEINTFSFSWGQAMFDLLLDLDIELKLGVFYKKDE